MVTPEGRLIPMIIAIGNHEVVGRYGQTPEQAKFFYALFRKENQSGYYRLDFGNYLSFFVLDSGHTNPVDGEQEKWLAKGLEERKNTDHKFAVYHVPAYPSVRNPQQKYCVAVRKHWVPLFEKFNLRTAFEHHDHAYKRTYPLKNQKINMQEGVLYMGDGAWGIKSPRTPATPSELWYLAKSASRRHFISVTLQENERIYEAVDSSGNIFDATTN